MAKSPVKHNYLVTSGNIILCQSILLGLGDSLH